MRVFVLCCCSLQEVWSWAWACGWDTIPRQAAWWGWSLKELRSPAPSTCVCITFVLPIFSEVLWLLVFPKGLTCILLILTQQSSETSCTTLRLVSIINGVKCFDWRVHLYKPEFTYHDYIALTKLKLYMTAGPHWNTKGHNKWMYFWINNWYKLVSYYVLWMN